LGSGRPRDARGRIRRDPPLAQRPAEEAAQAGEQPRRAARRDAGLDPRREVAEQHDAIGAGERAAARLEPARRAAEVGAVGGERVGGEAILHPYRIAEGIDVGLRRGRRGLELVVDAGVTGHASMIGPGPTRFRSACGQGTEG
jgi:hypothetical protein